MRNGARQSGGRGGIDAVMDVLLDVAQLDGGDQGTGARSPGRPPVESPPEPDTCERITLIEFLWTGSAGFQPVILVAREWLQ